MLNKPLPEEKGEDAKAQKALCDYLERNGLKPTVTIHVVIVIMHLILLNRCFLHQRSFSWVHVVVII